MSRGWRFHVRLLTIPGQNCDSVRDCRRSQARTATQDPEARIERPERGFWSPGRESELGSHKHELAWAPKVRKKDSQGRGRGRVDIGAAPAAPCWLDWKLLPLANQDSFCTQHLCLGNTTKPCSQTPTRQTHCQCANANTQLTACYATRLNNQ